VSRADDYFTIDMIEMIEMIERFSISKSVNHKIIQ